MVIPCTSPSASTIPTPTYGIRGGDSRKVGVLRQGTKVGVVRRVS